MEQFAYYPFKFGLLKIGFDEGEVTSLESTSQIHGENTPTSLTDNVHQQIKEYLAGERQAFNFPFCLKGTPFQLKVWQALCTIPYGETRTYKQVAELIGNSKASRAVGMANNKNPIAIVVPCHRVIGANGKLVGYAGGLGMKKTLLDLERENKKKQLTYME